MPLPTQNIPEKDKDKSWAKKCVMNIVMMSLGSRNMKFKDKFCYDLYNGIFDENDFDYLRKVDNYEYPAKIRFIPLLRPKMDLLRGEESRRALNFRVFTCDTTSLQSKEDYKVSQYMKLIKNKLDEKRLGVQAKMKELAQAQQLIAQVEQKAAQQQEEENPDSQNTVQAPPPEVPQKLKDEIEMAMSQSAIDQMITQTDLIEVDKYLKYNYKDLLEVVTERGLKYLITKYNLRDLFSLAFEDKLCTDKEIFHVDWTPGDPDPLVRKVNPLSFYYSSDDEAQWLGDCQWAMEERYMTINQIVDEFKRDLDEQQMDELNNLAKNMGYADDWNSGIYDNSTDECKSLYSGSTDYANKIRVCQTTWKSIRAIRFKKSKNKYGGKDFTKWLNDDDKLSSEDKSDVRFVNDVWEGIQIGEGIFIRLRKRKHQLRSVDKYGKVDLPYVGIAFNFINRKPYSLMWAAKDIQILYNIIHYQKELWLSLSGVKGFIMDKSQLPEGMSMKEWIYQRKIGIGWIESVKEGMARQPTFNQFQQYDDTVTPAIQYLVSILNHLEELASQITGVSRQRQGTIVPTDQVGTTEQSIGQSALVTEIIYKDHERVIAQVFTRLVNLCKIAWKNGKRGSYVLGDLGQEILKIDKGQLSKADYETFVGDGGKTDQSIRELKQMAAQEYGKGMMQMTEILQIYNIDNLKELEKSLEYYSEIAQQRQQDSQESAQQSEERKAQMEAQVTQMAQQQEAQFKSMDAQLQQARLQFDQEKFQLEQQWKREEAGMKYGESAQSNVRDNQTDMEQTKIDAQVEMAYLDQKVQEAKSDHKLKVMELAMSQNDSGGDKPAKKKGTGGENKKSTGGFGNREKVKD